MSNQSFDEIVRAAVKYNSSEVTNEFGRAFADTIFDLIATAVKDGHRVYVPGFGSFRLARTKARRIRNPVTQELMEIPESERIAFRASRRSK